jgi:hypothetical protein
MQSALATAGLPPVPAALLPGHGTPPPPTDAPPGLPPRSVM